MKQLYTLSISILASSIMLAQTTITSSDVGNVGTIIQHFNCETEGIEPGASGNNITWDFSNLVAESDTAYISFIDAASTSHHEDFASANLAQEEENSNLSYFELNSSEYTYWGSVANDGNGGQILYTYSDAAQYFAFPLNFGDANSDDLLAGYTADGLEFSRTGTIETEYDGFGTLILPTGTFENVSRIKIHEDNNDEASTFGQTIAINTTITTYEWIQVGNPEPLLIVAEVVVNSFGSETISHVVKMSPRTPSVVGIQETKTNNTFVAYPNPTQNNITINTAPNTVVSILNSNGKVVMNKLNPNGNNDISELTDGVYFLQFNSNGVFATQKLIKQ